MGRHGKQFDATASGDFSAGEASLSTWVEGLSNGPLRQDFGEKALNTELLLPLQRLLKRAVQMGYGEEDLMAAIKVMNSGAGRRSSDDDDQ